MSFARFARRIVRRGLLVENNATKLTRETAVQTLTEIVFATPVDTGRARSNWLVGIGAPRREKVGPSTDLATVSDGEAKIGRARGNEEIWISNNVEYISELNNGSSA